MAESESKRKRDKDVILKRVAAISTIFASLITIITKVLSIVGYVPKILFKAFLFLTLLIILVWVIYVSMTPFFARVLRRWKEVRRNKFIVKRYFDDFAGFVDRLEELLRDRCVDNMPYVFTNLRNMPPEFNYPRSLIYDLANLLAIFKEAMKKIHRRNFRLLIKWFDSILQVYNSQLVLQPFQQIRNLYRERLNEHDRETYEKSRENYVRFLQDYTNFAKAINKDCGKGIARDYFDKPGILQKA